MNSKLYNNILDDKLIKIIEYYNRFEYAPIQSTKSIHLIEYILLYTISNYIISNNIVTSLHFPSS